jgi:signal transduction histidine kinase/DNA-binding response OmpR family regulator/CHASE3 domain sensor protein
MKWNSLGNKISAGFIVVIILLSVVVSATLYGVANTAQHSTKTFTLDVPTAQQSLEIKTLINRSLAVLGSWVTTGQPGYRQELTSIWQEIDSASQTLSTLIRQKQIEQTSEVFRGLQLDLATLKQHQLDIAAIAHTPDNNPGLKMLLEEAAPKAEQMQADITEMLELEVFAEANTERKQLLKVMADFRGSLTSSLANIRAYLLTSDIKFHDLHQQLWIQNDDSFLYLFQHRNLLNEEQQRHFSRLSRLRDEFAPLRSKMFALRSKPEWDIAKTWLGERVAPLEKNIGIQLNRLVSHEQGAMAQSMLEIQQGSERLFNITAISLLLGVLGCMVLARYITRLVVRPINQVMQLADTISTGDFKVNTELAGTIEIEQLSDALQKMTAMLKAATEHAERVASNELSRDFTPKSEADQLGQALATMTKNLRQVTRLSSEQNWFKSGQSGLSDCLRGDLTVHTLSQNALNYIGDYIHAQVGAFYLRVGDTLKLTTGYAYKIRNTQDCEFALGEGIVGQAALEKRAILFKQLDEGQAIFTVNSGLGESSVNSILVVPLLNQQSQTKQLVGVIALASCQEFSPLHLELLEKMAESLAIALESAHARDRLNALLEESQRQTEELQAQQEELASANEELLEQAATLKRSEEELLAQGEDLKTSNQELADKSERLEKQKLEIERKNQDVEEARAELEHRAAALEKASKYKSEFLANMSHELRTPLNSLLILSQMLTRNPQGNLTEEQVTDINMIYDGGKSLLSLINDILDLSKVEAGKLKLNFVEVDVATFAKVLEKQFMPMAQSKQLQFSVTLDTDAPTSIRTDAMRLEQVVRNLISNALKFTEQGSVEVRIGASGEEELTFAVTDTGIGIAAEKQLDIFEAFQQADGSTSRHYGGTGLGLAISRELTKLLGGTIRLDSTVGQGSTFTLLLPLQAPTDNDAALLPRVPSSSASESTALVPSPMEATTAAPEPKGLSAPPIQSDVTELIFIEDDRARLGERDRVLLIIEDDADFAHTLINIAHSKGFKCLATNQGLVALRLIMQYQINAIILDLGLTDIDGLRVLDSLKSSPMTRDIPVHIVSARDSDETLLQRGAMGFLQKPLELDALEKVFSQFATLTKSKVKRVLLIEDDLTSCELIPKFLKQRNMEITTAFEGQQGLDMLQKQEFDCIILDLKLPDMSGFEWLEQTSKQGINLPPTVVYTGQELTDEEYKSLLRYTDRIVIKGAESPERLQDEVTLFLHGVKEKNPVVDEDLDIDSHRSALQGKRVLVVDDDLRNSYALSKALKEFGLEVVIADNGELALEKLKNELKIDLIIMDIMMPVMDGYEAMKEIRHQYESQHPIIALTAKAMAEDREKCLQAGANDYLPKPVDIQRLVSMVKVWLYQ